VTTLRLAFTRLHPDCFHIFLPPCVHSTDRSPGEGLPAQVRPAVPVSGMPLKFSPTCLLQSHHHITLRHGHGVRTRQVWKEMLLSNSWMGTCSGLLLLYFTEHICACSFCPLCP